MNRRNFIASLVALPAGLVAAAKACAAPLPLNLDEIFAQLYAIRKTRQSDVIDVIQWWPTTGRRRGVRLVKGKWRASDQQLVDGKVSHEVLNKVA